MADKADKKPDAAPPAAEKRDPKGAAGAAPAAGHGGGGGGGGGGAGGMLSKTPVLLGGVMLIEAAVLFAGFKFLGGGPAPAAGAELAHDAAHGDGGGENSHGEGGKSSAAVDKKSFVEIEVLSFRAPNKQSGRTFLYDVSIYVVAKADKEELVKKTFEGRKALITDRVRTIIAQSDPEKLGGGSEPGLETLRRQVKYQLDEIVGEGVIEEVLVPRCIPFRTDY
jgi:flagellar basal body-associated protein FliL